MKKSPELDPLAPRPKLNFSKGVRGKYAGMLQERSNVVIISPDLLDAFPDSESVNRALRSLKRISRLSAKPTRGKTASTGR
jgi:hypothetical protein